MVMRLHRSISAQDIWENPSAIDVLLGFPSAILKKIYFIYCFMAQKMARTGCCQFKGLGLRVMIVRAVQHHRRQHNWMPDG
jgi:hypothetical protein